MKYPLSSVVLSESAQAYAIETIHSGWVSGTGSYVPRFEEALRQHHQRRYALACSNGTDALRIALRGLNIQPGAEVIVPALTFVSPAAVAASIGAVPIFADIHPDHWTLDPANVEALITPRTSAIIAVDLLGHPADFDALHRIASEYNLPVIEDAAEAHGAFYCGKPTGSFGTISTFSFHSNKSIPIGEAGAVLTDFQILDNHMRLYINHGMTPEQPYYHTVLGDNCRLPNTLAAIGLGQYQNWDALVSKRQQVARWYDGHLSDLLRQGRLQRRPVASWASESVWLYTLWHEQRGRIIDHLRANDIDARAIWTPLCDLPIYADACRGNYSNARRIGYGAFWLPTHAGMTEADVAYICGKLRECVE